MKKKQTGTVNDDSSASSASSIIPKWLSNHTLEDGIRNLQPLKDIDLSTGYHNPQLRKRKKMLNSFGSRKRYRKREKEIISSGESDSSSSISCKKEVPKFYPNMQVYPCDSDEELPSPTQIQETSKGLTNLQADEEYKASGLNLAASSLTSQKRNTVPMTNDRMQIFEEGSFKIEEEAPLDQEYDVEVETQKEEKLSHAVCPTHYPQGWWSPSELRAIATEYRGLAIQYRVCYAEKEMKDNKTKKIIPRNTLIVQSRFVSEAGHKGGQSFCFLTWRIPGCIQRSTSIYDGTRPHLWDDTFKKQQRNAYPLIAVDEDMHEVVKLLVKTFLKEAVAGTSPLEFYADGNYHELFFLSHKPKSPTKRRTQEVHSLATSNISPLESFETNETKSVPGDNEESTATKNSSYSGSSVSYKTMTPVDDVHIPEIPTFDNIFQRQYTNKNSCSMKYPKQSPARFEQKRKKAYGKLERKRHTAIPPIYFDVAPNILSEPRQVRSLVLVEGLSKVEDVFLDQSIDHLPTQGRLLELTSNSTLAGRWRAKSETKVPGLLRDLEGLQLMLRHERYLKLGALSDKVANGVEFGEEVIHVSKIDPSHNRVCELVQQGVVAGEEDIALSKIGSISLAICEGCLSSSDAHSEYAGNLAAKVLKSAKGNIPSERGFCSLDDLENLIAIPNLDTILHESNNDITTRTDYAGVSLVYQCKVHESYHVFIGQDEDNNTVAVDVSLRPSSARLSLHSTSTDHSTAGAKLTAENVKVTLKKAESQNKGTIVATKRDRGTTYEERSVMEDFDCCNDGSVDSLMDDDVAFSTEATKFGKESNCYQLSKIKPFGPNDATNSNVADAQSCSPDPEAARERWLEAREFLNQNATSLHASHQTPSRTKSNFRSKVTGDTIGTSQSKRFLRLTTDHRTVFANNIASKSMSTTSIRQEVPLVSPHPGNCRISKQTIEELDQSSVAKVKSKLCTEDGQNDFLRKNSIEMIESTMYRSSTPRFIKKNSQSLKSRKSFNCSKHAMFLLFIFVSFKLPSPPSPNYNHAPGIKMLRVSSIQNPTFHHALNQTIQPLNQANGFLVVKSESVSLVVAAILLAGFGVGCL